MHLGESLGLAGTTRKARTDESRHCRAPPPSLCRQCATYGVETGVFFFWTLARDRVDRGRFREGRVVATMAVRDHEFVDREYLVADLPDLALIRSNSRCDRQSPVAFETFIVDAIVCSEGTGELEIEVLTGQQARRER